MEMDGDFRGDSLPNFNYSSREAMTVEMMEKPRKWCWYFGGRIPCK